MSINLKALLRDKLIQGTLVLTMLNLAGAVLNYLVHPILARRLSVAEYGDYQALLSFMTLIGLCGGIFFTTLTKEISLRANDLQAVASIRRRGMKQLGVIGLVLFCVTILFSSILNQVFKISSGLALLYTALSLLAMFPVLVNRAVFNGLQKFVSLALNTFLDQIFRLVGILLFVVLIPWRIDGAALALGLSGWVAWNVSSWQIKKLALPVATTQESFRLRSLVREAWLVLWFTIVTQVLFNLDILFVKSVFSPTDAGLYSALLTVGRVVYFLGFAAASIVLPVVANLKIDRSMRKYSVLLKSLGISCALSLPIVGLMNFFPAAFLHVLLGSQYASVSFLLPAFSWAMFFLTVVTLLSQYFLAVDQHRALMILFGGIGLEVLLLMTRHASLTQIVHNLLLTFGLLTVLLASLLWVSYQKDLAKIVSYEKI